MIGARIRVEHMTDSASVPPDTQGSRSSRKAVLLLGGLGAAIIAAVVWSVAAPVSSATLQELVLSQEFDKLLPAARYRLRWFPYEHSTRVVYGEALQRAGEIDAAVLEYQRIPADQGDLTYKARLATASILVRQGLLEQAGIALDDAEAVIPDTAIVDRLRVAIANLCGVREPAVMALLRLIDTDVEPLENLVFLAVSDEMPAPEPQSLAVLMKSPDPLAKLGAARVASAVGKSDLALEMFRDVIKMRPVLVDAYVQIAQILLDLGRRDEARRELARAPESANESPQFWEVQGRLAFESGRKDVATRCYWEACRRNPNMPKACYQLGLLLANGPFDGSARKLQFQSRTLVELQTKALQLHRGRGNPDTVLECARLALKLGRIREARVWGEYLLAGDPGHPEGRPFLHSLMTRWKPDLPWVLPENNYALAVEGGRFPLPVNDLPLEGSISPPANVVVGNSPSSLPRLCYRDLARETGLQFAYQNGDDPTTEGKRMFEYTGGGVAAIDFDKDGWPDIYFTQGTRWPPDPAQTEYADLLYRNLQGERFANVTNSAGILETKFSQGVSAGDIDNDGFPDLYVGNIGGNRLFENLGDGTFHEITSAAGVGHTDWTTSCAIADLDGDSQPDLYDVTFLTGADVFQRVCEDNIGRKRSCAPAGFDAAPDHVYFSQGDGTWADKAQSAGFAAKDGDGLGILVGDFSHTGRAQVFIANDGRANFLFIPQVPINATSPTTLWSESAVNLGCAFDEVGQPQACMGIAAGDLDGDGFEDLYVTNFFLESNTLYLNSGAGGFSDRTRQFGLRIPSLDFLGFGCQCLDPDHDGRLDLVVANGHVDDFSYKNIPYKMRPQFFLNRGERFDELTGESVSGTGTPRGQDYFKTPSLGRGLALTDWNRDGRMDFVVSQLEAPSALVTDCSDIPANSLRIRVVGTSVSRDATGTRFEWNSGDRRQVRQVFAGDGYHASNEKLVEFGGGPQRSTGTLVVHWPDGKSQSFPDVDSGQQFILVQGREQMLLEAVWLPASGEVARSHP